MDAKQQVSLVRPFDFSDRNYHLDKWKEKNITVLICQRNTNDLIRLCLESLLRFYPDIQILVVDGTSSDCSASYLKYKSAINTNITIWTRSGVNSHGVTMDEAIRQHIKTKYVLLMDSDVIIERSGLIEDMLSEFPKDDLLYAIGSLMLVTRLNHACGPPLNDSDILRYAHPSFSIYDVDRYLQINVPFVDHGAPCVYNMLKAEELKLHINYYPVDKYVSHLSGGSWTEPRTIWANDHDVPARPFVTFIINNSAHLEQLKLQADHDFDIITTGRIQEKNVVIHGSAPVKFTNDLYDIRYSVLGEYVCLLPKSIETIQPNFVSEMKRIAINEKIKEEINVGGLICISRKLWQRKESIK